jgi:sulfate permease, SulP family
LGVRLFEINGPLFFGAAQNAVAALEAARGEPYFVMILHLGKVPVIDSTGFVALDTAIGSLMRHRHDVVLAGPLPRPRVLFDKAHLQQKHPALHIAPSLDAAVELARALAAARRESRSDAAE